ncbi:hypothetical protein BDZ89DRAFT_1141410 [Hymenopellis radicata]|nr:hypothetical protein BDZ89DRAFT_1141410 [Hymenopellis radicata]
MRTLHLLPTAIHVLADFYGLSVPTSCIHVSDEHPSGSITPQDSLQTLLRWLSCSHPPPHISWYASGNDIDRQPPPSIASAWSDLNAPHPSFISQRRLTFKSIHWRIRGDGDHTYYFDWPPYPSLRLLLFRATDVLWFLRQHAKNAIERVVASMLTLGIRFSFATVCTETSLPSPPSPLHPVPWRRTPFNANTLEYHQYIARRARLFSSSSVLRAALMAGGILWRLAIEHVEDPQVAFGASFAQTPRSNVRSTESTGVVLCEAGLTDNELDIILGTYLVSPEYPPSQDCSEVSWFPKNFSNSGIDVGFWSEDAENWYQDRLRAYLNGKEQPCTKGQWHGRLRLYRPARTFAKGYDTIACLKLDQALLDQAM